MVWWLLAGLLVCSFGFAGFLVYLRVVGVLYYVGVYLRGGLVVWVVWVVVCCVDLVGYDFGWLVCCWLVVFDFGVVGFRSVSVCGLVVSLRVCCVLVFVGFD